MAVISSMTVFSILPCRNGGVKSIPLGTVSLESYTESVMELDDTLRARRAFALGAGQHIAYQDIARREALRLRGVQASDGPHVTRVAAGQAALFDALPITLDPDNPLPGAFSPTELTFDAHAMPLDLPPLVYPPDVAAGLDDLHRAMRGEGWLGHIGWGHAQPHFALVLTRGMAALAAEADAAADTLPPDRAAASRAMATALHGVIRFAERHADAAEAHGLPHLAALCRRVPAHPARTYHEALQAVWFTYLTLGMTESPSANSLGNADSYLAPYVDSTPEDAHATLTAHFLLNCACCAEGQALTLGGPDADPRLTRLFLDVAAVLALPEPIIALRVHDATPPAVLDDAMRLVDARTGNPSFYAEARCRAMLAGRGVLEAEMARLAINSCMGVVVGGAEVCDMWDGIVALPLCLEIAAAGGCAPDGTPLPTFHALCKPAYASIEELWTAYGAVVARATAVLADRLRTEHAYHAQWTPNPLLSALLDDCRTRGLDRYAGGPRYASGIIEGMGWANVGDSLLAVEELVFRRGVTTLPALLAAARSDYAGTPELLRAVRACPKYGNDDPAADALAVRVVEGFATAVSAQTRPGAGPAMLPSLHTLHHNVSFGRLAPVSLDGRRYGAPLNKQVGPSPWSAQAGTTAVLASAARIPTDRLPGGQALDITLPGADTTPLPALLRGYFALGGADLQVNVADPAVLRAARAYPEAHAGLLVRVAGYSEFFVKLDPATQDDLIARCEAGL
jgi:formate C-acetyltransferase